MLASLFFVSAHKDSATRHGCALRSACRGVSERQWRSAANRSQLPLRSVLGAPHWGAAPEAAAETKSFCPCHKTGGNSGFLPVFFLHVLHGYVVHFGSDFGVPHLSAPASPLSSTQNAPGFAFFGLNRVRLAVFVLF